MRNIAPFDPISFSRPGEYTEQPSSRTDCTAPDQRQRMGKCVYGSISHDRRKFLRHVLFCNTCRAVSARRQTKATEMQVFSHDSAQRMKKIKRQAAKLFSKLKADLPEVDVLPMIECELNCRRPRISRLIAFHSPFLCAFWGYREKTITSSI